MKLRELRTYGIRELRNVEEASIKIKILLKYLLNVDTSFLVINQDKEIDPKTEEIFIKDLEKLKNGMPVQYITNTQEFMKYKFFVDENVLIPQPDTEILVEEVVKLAKKSDSILDLCTGSGAIGISICAITGANVTLSDISEKALKIAKKNSINILEKNLRIVKSDMFENINDKYDIIVSNPPYINEKDMENLNLEVKHEPLIALYGGKDGLNYYKIIAKNAVKYLKENGILALEIGYNQRNSVIELLKKEKNYKNIYCKKDISGNDRIIIATKDRGN